MGRHCQPRPEKIVEMKRELAEMKAISAAVAGLPGKLPMGELFNFLRKQPMLTPVQRRGLELWDGGHKNKLIIVPRRQDAE